MPASAPPEKKKKKSKKEKAKGSQVGQTGVLTEGVAKPGNSGKGKRKGKRHASPPPPTGPISLPALLTRRVITDLL